MKTLIYSLIICGLFIGCNTSKSVVNKSTKEQQLTAQDTVKIANDDIGYQIIIIEPGFNSWLASTAKPEGYYSQGYLEGRNLQYVTAYNQRVIQPQYYNSGLYDMQIDYQPNTDYGYEVNYKLYNYFIYFQIKYKQQLAGYIPRI